jgi:hypothetical protein
VVKKVEDLTKGSREAQPDGEQVVRRAAATIRAYHAVAVVGAGLSWAAGMPLVSELWPLLWDALDRDPPVRDALARRLGRPPVSAKRLVFDDPALWRPALEALASSRAARSAFQQAFAKLDAERVRRWSPAHDALAELLHRRIVEFVVSFNWDTLLETAYRRRYGVPLHADGEWLAKPHGDAADPESDWILPHEAGYVPDAVAERVRALAAQYPRTLLVVGYSGNDAVVVDKLVGPLSDQWRVIRISPSSAGELSIAWPAEQGLPALAREVAPGPEVPGWEHVNFDYQRGISHALIGEGLGPADVLACPRLPEVAQATQQLRVTDSVLIVGKSGSGKSITAYQAAHDLNRSGWEVLRLIDRTRRVEDLVAAVTPSPQPAVAVLDDAQALDERLVRTVLERAGRHLKVVIVSTEPITGQVAVRIAAERAVGVLADAFRGRQEETLAAVRAMDPMVGDAYLDIPLERRLDAAAEQKTPWHFSFVLTGGWQRAHQQVASLRDFDRADLLLAAIGAVQIASRDAPVPCSWLHVAAAALGRDATWLTKALEVLIRERAVLAEDGYRCPHSQYAIVVLKVLCRDRNDASWTEILAMLRAALEFADPPLRGVAWLLHELWFADAFRWKSGGFGTVVNDFAWQRLLERCWAALSGEERSGAAFALNELRHWHPRQVAAIEERATLLAQWIEDATPESTGGLGRLLNDIGQEEGGRDVVRAICAAVDPHRIATSLNRMSWSEAWGWGWLLGRIAYNVTPEWRERLVADLDVEALRALFLSVTVAELESIPELVEGVAEVDYRLSLDLLGLAAPIIGDSLGRSPVATWQAVGTLILFFLRYESPGLGVPPPTRPQRRIGQRITRAVDSTLVAQALSGSRRCEWPVYHEVLIFLNATVPQSAQSVISKVDFYALDRLVGDMWATMPYELERLVWAMFVAEGREAGRVSSWIETHADELAHVTTHLTLIAPNAVAMALRKGHHLDLDVDKGWDWIPAVLAVVNLEQVDRGLATKVLADNRDAIARGLGSLREYDCAGVPPFLQVLQELTPAMVPTILAEIDAALAEEHWANRLRGKVAEREAAAALIELAISGPEGNGGGCRTPPPPFPSGIHSLRFHRDDLATQPKKMCSLSVSDMVVRDGSNPPPPRADC